MIAKYRNAGQTCICANRIYVHADVYEEFVSKLATKVGAMKVVYLAIHFSVYSFIFAFFFNRWEMALKRGLCKDR
jgi:hypothetical protein